MGLFDKFRRHAAIATGNFAYIFKDVEIPPLPAAVSRLVSEANQPDPDFERLARLISATTGLAAKVIQTVNSPLYGLQRPVTSVRHAVTLLGIKNIRSLALAYATMSALPRPKDPLFHDEAFWSDSLLHALLARAFCQGRFDARLEDAFTAALLAHVAVPVLMTAWSEYYRPLVEQWQDSSLRLSEIERRQFGWDHAQAGAWIVHHWEFPEELVCYIGAHNLTWEAIEAHELNNTIAVPLAVTAMVPSLLKPDPGRMRLFCESAQQWLGLSPASVLDHLNDVQTSFVELLGLFGLAERSSAAFFNELRTVIVHEDEAHDG